MKIIKDYQEDPIWNNVGQSSCDFRPHFDGDLINLFTCIMPEDTASCTEIKFKEHAREIAQWILDNRKIFSSGDRFQIIVGWPITVRATSRQIVKVGGDYKAISNIESGRTPIVLQRGWMNSIFNGNKTEQKSRG